MAIKITENCINCGNCEMKCPNQAIYEPGKQWQFNYGRNKKFDGTVVEAGETQAPLSGSVYYIVPEKCTECVGFHDEPQCISVCPVDSCVPDPEHVEDQEFLKKKKSFLQA